MMALTLWFYTRSRELSLVKNHSFFNIRRSPSYPKLLRLVPLLVAGNSPLAETVLNVVDGGWGRVIYMMRQWQLGGACRVTASNFVKAGTQLQYYWMECTFEESDQLTLRSFGSVAFQGNTSGSRDREYSAFCGRPTCQQEER
jgi:hypothetical protein